MRTLKIMSKVEAMQTLHSQVIFYVNGWYIVVVFSLLLYFILYYLLLYWLSEILEMCINSPPSFQPSYASRQVKYSRVFEFWERCHPKSEFWLRWQAAHFLTKYPINKQAINKIEESW